MQPLFQSPEIKLPSARRWFFEHAMQLVPRELEEVIAWADKHYRVVNKDRDTFNSADSPWLIEPLRMADDPLVSRLTYVKPIQAGGGTSLGEIMLMRWILGGSGLIGYYWPTNDKAKDRWEKWTEKRLRACKEIRAHMPREYENMFIKFANITFAMQGVFTSGNLDSDTVDYIVAEEVHQWEAGMLGKAKGRQTKVDFPKFLVISNAGLKGDQLHQEFNEGTQQHFEVACPGCSNPHHREANTVRHIMRTRWEDSRPELGGLRYDTEGCKRPDGTFDYNKLIPTIRFQMPCGYEMRDDVQLRRQAAMNGHYSEPFNTGALTSHRSYTLQAVACHTMRWIDLIQEKHIALRSLKAGDDANWRQYLQERESVFYDPEEHKPYQGETIYNINLKKNREGMPDRYLRSAKFDWQKGYKHLGELEHFWGVILDVDINANSQLVWEGKVESEAELLRELDAHDVPHINCWIDCTGVESKRLLQFCYQNGMNGLSLALSRQGGFLHEDGVRRFYSEGRPIYKILNTIPVFPPNRRRNPKNGEVIETPHPQEPIVVELHKGGMLANYFFIRNHKANVLKENPQATPADYISIEMPADVSEDFKKMLESWEIIPGHRPKNPDDGVLGFKPRSRRDHQLMNMAYHCFNLEWELHPHSSLSLLGERLAQLGLPQINQLENQTNNEQEEK